MTKAVAALFNTRTQARAAVSELVISGFPRDCVELKEGRELIGGPEGVAGAGGRKVEGILGRVVHNVLQGLGLVRTVERPNTAEAAGFRIEGIRPDDALVIVAANDDMAGRAAEILGSYDAVRVAQRPVDEPGEAGTL